MSEAAAVATLLCVALLVVMLGAGFLAWFAYIIGLTNDVIRPPEEDKQ